MEDKAPKSVGSFEDLEDELLPCWMTARMMTDRWVFGLMLSTGVTLLIECINKVSQAADGSIWLDVELREEPDHLGRDLPGVQFASPTSRTEATVNAAHVVAAFELADT